MHDAAGLLPRDQARLLEDAEVLDETGQRQVERLRELAHRRRSCAQPGEHRAAGRVGERVEHGIERAVMQVRGLMLNHMVKY